MPFSVKTLDFLVENRIQNSREWYHAHKEEFQQFVLQPMRELVEYLTPVINEIDPQLICEPKVERSISRVYRDTRFSKDKSLYREVMWCMFVRDKREFSCSPGLFFEFSPDGFRYGGGYYHTPTKTMEAARELILENHKTFQKASRAFEKQDVFYMSGELYKRPHYPNQPERLRNWLERRDIGFLHNSEDFDLLFSDKLPQVLEHDFRLLKPMHEFLCAAEERSLKNSLN